MDFLIIVVRLLAVCLALAGLALGQDANEYEVKAAFLFNFTKFVGWPSPPARTPFCIGIVGEDPFGSAMEDAVRNRTASGRPIEVRRFKIGAVPLGCEIVFLSVSNTREIRSALAPLQGTPTLTVGDAPGFCRAGGMIGLQLVDRKVRLEINPEAAQHSRLQLSSKLLALANLVREIGP